MRFLLLPAALLMPVVAHAATYQQLLDNATAVFMLQDTTGTAITNANGTAGTLSGVTADAATTTGPNSTLPLALTFDGVNDSIACGDLGVSEDRTFTMAVWVKTTSTLNTFAISEGNAATDNTLVGLASYSTDSRAWVRNDANAGTMATGAVVNDGNWHLLVQTADGTDTKLYVDGVLISTVTTPVAPITVTRATIGALGRTSVALYFQGDLAGAVFSTVAWSAQDVTTYKAGAQPSYETLKASAIAHYMPWGGTVDSPNDVSGNGNNGVWTDTASYVDGENGRAFLFSGINGVTATNSLPWSKTYSILLRHKKSSLNSNQWKDLISYGTSLERLETALTPNLLTHYGGSKTFASGTQLSDQIQDEVWYSSVITSNDSETKYYNDGVLQVTAAALLATDLTPFHIGFRSPGQPSWEGEIYDVMILGYGATAEDVAAYHDYTGPATGTPNRSLRIPIRIPLRIEVQQ